MLYIALAIKMLLAHQAVKTPADDVGYFPGLPLMLFALSGIFAWELLLALVKVYFLFTTININVLQFIGLTDYYLLFGLMNFLLFLIIKDLLAGKDTVAEAKNVVNSSANNVVKATTNETINPEYIRRIEQAMTIDKLFQNPNISCERLAEQLDIPVKHLSNAINRHFKLNFQEFINEYRINDAKENLQKTENWELNISDIFYMSGFNSKSVYNALFKKHFNTTPSQYRKQYFDDRR